ncbi:MAG: DciA family protein [Planctomycetota bacterium]
MDDKQLQTAWQNRQARETARPVGEAVALLMKHTLAKRVRQLGQIAAIWDEVIPADLAVHTALESYARGTLTVMVDSAPHRFQLDALLTSGARQVLAERCTGPLNRIKLIPGQFYSVDLDGQRRYAF